MDDTMHDGITVPDGGAYDVAANDAGLVHVGEDYISEFESLDIDSPQNPITGLPVTISNVLLRLSMGVQYQVGRARNSMTDVSFDDLFEDTDNFDRTLKYFQGVHDSMPFPGWKRDGRMVVRSKDGFPFSVAALVPQVDVGDLDV